MKALLGRFHGAHDLWHFCCMSLSVVVPAIWLWLGRAVAPATVWALCAPGIVFAQASLLSKIQRLRWLPRFTGWGYALFVAAVFLMWTGWLDDYLPAASIVEWYGRYAKLFGLACLPAVAYIGTAYYHWTGGQHDNHWRKPVPVATAATPVTTPAQPAADKK